MSFLGKGSNHSHQSSSIPHHQSANQPPSAAAAPGSQEGEADAGKLRLTPSPSSLDAALNQKPAAVGSAKSPATKLALSLEDSPKKAKGSASSSISGDNKTTGMGSDSSGSSEQRQQQVEESKLQPRGEDASSLLQVLRASSPRKTITALGIGGVPKSLAEGGSKTTSASDASKGVPSKMVGKTGADHVQSDSPQVSATAGSILSATFKAPGPEVPRRPLSAYNIFFSEQRELILAQIDAKDRGEDFDEAAFLQERRSNKEGSLPKALMKKTKAKRAHRKVHGKIGLREMARMVGKRWKELPADEKEYYTNLAREDKVRQQKAYADYEAARKEQEAEQTRKLQEEQAAQWIKGNQQLQQSEQMKLRQENELELQHLSAMAAQGFPRSSASHSFRQTGLGNLSRFGLGTGFGGFAGTPSDAAGGASAFSGLLDASTPRPFGGSDARMADPRLAMSAASGGTGFGATASGIDPFLWSQLGGAGGSNANPPGSMANPSGSAASMWDASTAFGGSANAALFGPSASASAGHGASSLMGTGSGVNEQLLAALRGSTSSSAAAAANESRNFATSSLAASLNVRNAVASSNNRMFGGAAAAASSSFGGPSLEQQLQWLQQQQQQQQQQHGWNDPRSQGNSGNNNNNSTNPNNFSSGGGFPPGGFGGWGA